MSLPFLLVILSLKCVLLIQALDLVSTGATLRLNGVPYFVPSKAIGKLPSNSVRLTQEEDTNLLPVTITVAPTSKFDRSDYDKLKADFSAKDDVFQAGFLQALYVQHTQSGDPASNGPTSIDNCTIQSLHRPDSDMLLPPGPYFVSIDGSVHEAYRLYADSQGAFAETVIKGDDGSFSVLSANLQGQSMAVGVPSRLYYTKTSSQPLAGVRVGIKDLFSIKGIKTAAGSRAWYELYPPANRTATAVQNLIDAGAVIVGKMKTSQFAIGETATADWVDVHAPFNPRGDGYQDPSSSSAGPAAGEASYPWLDLTIGTDTGGSVRSPSQVNGVFGNRPSHGLVALDDVVPIAPELDTVGILARDPVVWKIAAQALYKEKLELRGSFPRHLLTVGFPNDPVSDSDRILLEFLANLTQLLSANASVFSINDSWAATNPSKPPLQVYLNDTYDVITSRQQVALVKNPFFADYAAKFDGRTPFVNPSPLVRWSFASTTQETLEEAIRKKTDFRDWFNTEILTDDPAACSKQLLVYVPRKVAPKYRNTYLDGVTPPAAFSISRVSPLADTPDFVLPIGEVTYNSTITNHTEALPLTIDLMVRKGCDGMLFSLIEALSLKGIVQKSKAGRSNTAGGEVLL